VRDLDDRLRWPGAMSRRRVAMEIVTLLARRRRANTRAKETIQQAAHRAPSGNGPSPEASAQLGAAIDHVMAGASSPAAIPRAKRAGP
jgi:hypothetical protein